MVTYFNLDGADRCHQPWELKFAWSHMLIPFDTTAFLSYTQCHYMLYFSSVDLLSVHQFVNYIRFARMYIPQTQNKINSLE